MSLATTIAKNSLFNFIGTAADVIINFAIGILLARGLGTEVYGLYSVLMSFLALAMVAVNLGLGDMARRFVAESLGRGKTDEPPKIIRQTLLLRSITAVAASLVIVLFAGYWARLFGDEANRTYFFILAFGLAPSILNYALGSIFAGFQRYDYAAYAILSTNTLRLVAVVFVMVIGLGLKELLICNISAWFIGVLVGIVLLHRIAPLKAILSATSMESSAKKTAFRYALTVAGVLVVEYFLWRQAEMVFLGVFRTPEEVGFYSVAVKIPSMAMALIPSVLGTVLVPSISEQFGRGDTHKMRMIYQSSARYLMVLALPLAAAGIALARPLVNLLYGPDYAPAILVMQVLFVPFAMMSIALAATSTMYGINQPSFILKVGLIMTSLSIGLYFYLIPRYGIMGAAIASSIPRLLCVPMYARFLRKKINVAWPLADTAKILLASFLTGTMLFALQKYLGSNILSLVLSIPVGIAIYVASILVLRAVDSQDLNRIKGLQKSLPPALRNGYVILIEQMERFVERSSVIQSRILSRPSKYNRR
jgi:O-antigen/teichoic acid export membrane protein